MKVSKETRRLARELYRGSFTERRLDPAKVMGVVKSVADAKPRHYRAVLTEYQRLIRLEAQQHHAVIESAEALDHDTAHRTVGDLRARYGADLSAEFKVVPDLIGGLRVKIGSDVWDGSIRNRLDRLQSQLAA